MKKNLAIILALVLAVSLLLPAGAFATADDTYNVLFELNGPNAGNANQVAKSSYRLQSGSLKLKEVAANYATDSVASVESKFAGTGLRAVFEDLKAKATSGTASDWAAMISALTIEDAEELTLLSNSETLLWQLEEKSPIVVKYKDNDAYSVTMTVEKYVAPSGDTSSTSATEEETVEGTQGADATLEKDENGDVTQYNVEVDEDATEATVPVTVEEETPIAIDIPNGKTVTVEIPVEGVKPTTVVKLIKPDGTEEILPVTAMTEGGLKLTLDDDVTIKIENVEVTNDIPEDVWYKDAMDYVEAREILADIPAANVAPLDACDRGTFTTMLYNLCRQPDATSDSDFVDVDSADFYNDAVAWARENNIVKGISDTEFDGDSVITREQIVTILWRFAGCPASTAVETGASDWAADAMSWAVSIGLIKGNGDGTGYRPQDGARVAEAATIIMDFVNGGYAGTSI